MPTYDVISIGSAVLDILLKSSQFVPHTLEGEMMLCEVYGGKADVEDASLCSGGAGTNTSVGFSRQGLHSAVVAEIGKDFAAQLIVDELKRENVDTSLLIEESNEQTGISAILVASNGSRSALTFRGAAKMLSSKDIPFEVLKKTTHIHLSSVGNADLIREIFLFCEQNQISLSWNPSKSELEEVLLRSGTVYENVCSIIFVNDQEFAVIESKKEHLLRMSDLVVITKGKEGGEIWDHGQKKEYKSLSVEVVSELGAGDAFACGFVGAYIQKMSLAMSIEWGVRNASSVVQHLGAKKGLLSFS